MSFDLKPFQSELNFTTDRQKIVSFILFFPSQDAPKYISKQDTIRISLTDVYLYDDLLFSSIIRNTHTYREMFYKAFDRIFYDDKEIVYDGKNVMMYHRLARLKEKMPDVNVTDILPGELLRDYEVCFVMDDCIVRKMEERLRREKYASENEIDCNLDILKHVNNSNNNNIIRNYNNIIEDNNINNNSNNNKLADNNINNNSNNSNNININDNNNKLNIIDYTEKQKYNRDSCIQEKKGMHEKSKYLVQPGINNREGLYSCFVTIRDLLAAQIGKYVLTRGIVTKTTQIKPFIQLAAHICESCGSETYQPVSQESFNPLLQCNSMKCKEQKIKTTLVIQTRSSKFTTFQEVTLSESVNDIPFGCIPRSMKMHCFGSLAGILKPGDCVYASGVFTARKNYGLSNDTFIHAHSFYNESGCIKKESTEKEDAEQEDREYIEDNINLQDSVFNGDRINFDFVRSTVMRGVSLPPSFINLLVDSFAPEIYNLVNIKKVLLLALTGSQTKEEHFMKIRGTINVLLVGDPGVAKSQLLKTVQRISPRGVFTTGKGSSGVGLTASVVKDPLTREMVLEGGALVLSDNGVCCIDELDKMRENDRVSIHEVMEQQSISINKAGINTNLNARCSIVGAANPVRGSFRRDRSLEWNLGLPVALLSRFDCVCILKDDINAERDRSLAEHITRNFLSNKNTEDDPEYKTENNKDEKSCKEEKSNKDKKNNNDVLENKTMNNKDKKSNKDKKNNKDDLENTTMNNKDEKSDKDGESKIKYNFTVEYDQMREYIEQTKKINPMLSPALGGILVDAYIEKRRNKENITPRYLLSLIRFSLAHARLRLSREVVKEDIEEALRLMDDHMYEKEYEPTSQMLNKERIIYKAILSSIDQNNEVNIDRIFDICKNYKKEEIESVINTYIDTGAMLLRENIIRVRK